MEWKMPPKAKIYEAISAVLDGRVRLTGTETAEVSSSGGDKLYKIKWAGETITSSDPASRFQGYLGYPALAVLFITGRLSFDPYAFEALRGVPWKQVNDRFKRDYDAAVLHVLTEHGADSEQMARDVDEIYRQLASLKLQRPASAKAGG